MTAHPPERTSGLLFRRQFILIREPGHAMDGGKNLRIGNHHLSVHPDLAMTHVVHDGKSLTLLGFALDPHHPESSDEQILQDIIHRVGNCADVFALTENLGGRWAMIVQVGGETLVIHDATAQRQVYHARDAHGHVVCASEPALLAEKLGLEMNAQAMEFIKSRGADDFEIYWMPGDTSLFAEISALLPNHYLSLDTGVSRRFWPRQALPPAAHEEAVAECKRLLCGQVRAAALRNPLAVPMTAGWDSRLMLALCRDHADDLYAFTLDYPNLPPGSRDVAVPARLLEKLGIPHHVIAYPAETDIAFKEIFRRNNASANDAYCADIQALHEVYPQNRICVTGDAAEIVKCYYERKRTGPVTPEELADFSRLGKNPFALHAFARWLEDAGSPTTGLLDLFCWEQMAGRWQAKIRAEYDMVQESFSPLNNRRFLSLMLAMDPALRRAPDHLVFKSLIHSLWPDTLAEPINPPEKTGRARRLINAVKSTGVMRFIPDAAVKKAKALFH
jgi:hypothetical protein